MLKDSKTKLICTIGPSTYNYEVFKELAKEGMNVARVNGSHATDEEIATVVSNVTNANKELNTNVAILFDIAGPKIRTGTFINGEVTLRKGNYVSIVRENIVGDETKFTINNKSLIDNLKVGDTVYLNDGLLTLKVVEVSSDEVKCFIANDCKIKDRRGVNVPGLFYDVDFLEDKDRIMIKKALENNTTFLALSFVQTRNNILEVKEYVRSLGYEVPKIIAKIESYSALVNIDEILDEVDGIMIARGDLALEVDVEQVPIIQKKFVKKAKMKNKLAIVATEMMGSMIDSPRPTRAELTDVCNAVFDMADAVMLSGETTIGQYPVETVRYMKTLCKTSEANPDLMKKILPYYTEDHIASTIARLANLATEELDAKCIIVPTTTGKTAILLSTLRPNLPIVATCLDEKIARFLALAYGVTSIKVNRFDTIEEVIKESKVRTKEALNLSDDDLVIITGGSNNKDTDLIKIERI